MEASSSMIERIIYELEERQEKRSREGCFLNRLDRRISAAFRFDVQICFHSGRGELSRELSHVSTRASGLLFLRRRSKAVDINPGALMDPRSRSVKMIDLPKPANRKYTLG